MLTAVPGGAVGTPFTYPYDAHGNMTAMPHLTTMDWDFHDRLRHTAVSASGSISQESWYVYDADGQRVRKVVTKGNVTEERLYFGNIEIFRRSRGGAIELERETLHVTDDTRRIAMVDTPTVKPAASKETQLTRYQYANHLGTACLELDDAAQIISYEEYYPFGSTSYQGTDQSREIPAKRYRYIGKERDEETGFYYHGARYYAPWLARWTAADPTGTKGGLNVYGYCSDNPIRLHDPNGTQATEAHASEGKTVVQVTYDAPADPAAQSQDPVPQGIPPLSSETGTPATVFGNQTQSLGQGLQPNDPQALGGSQSYSRGLQNPFGPSRRQFFPYLDLEVNFIGSGVGGGGPSLPAGGFTAQISARVAPIPGLPNLTLGAFGSEGPAGQRGVPGVTQGTEGISAQYGVKLAPGLGVGVFAQGSASESSSGPTTYSGTVTPILQYQPNDKTQLVLNPTLSVGTGGSFANQGSYGSFVTAGGLVGAQLSSHLILEGGATYTAAARPQGDTTSSTGELRVITGVGYTGTLSADQGGPTTFSLVLNPFVGIPSGAEGQAKNVTAAGALLTGTVAFRVPLFEVPQRERPNANR